MSNEVEFMESVVKFMKGTVSKESAIEQSKNSAELLNALRMLMNDVVNRSGREDIEFWDGVVEANRVLKKWWSGEVK